MRHIRIIFGRHRDSPHQGHQRRHTTTDDFLQCHQQFASNRVIETLTKSAVDPHIMDITRHTQLIRQRAVAKSSITRLQTLIETGDRKLNNIQARFDELQNIYNKFETA